MTCSFRGEICVTIRPYSAVVRIGSKTFVGTIPLTNEEYVEFLLREYSAVQYVLAILRADPTHTHHEFDETNVTLYEQSDPKTRRQT